MKYKDNDNTTTLLLTFITILMDGQFHSKKQLVELLGINLAAINNYVHVLQDWGIDVFSMPGKGYILTQQIHLLDEQFICSNIETGSVKVLSVIDSTNQYLLDHLPELHSGDACVAEYQKSGRGRRGRKWFSPFGANLYLSMYWCFEQRPANVVGLSLVIAIVIAEVLQEICGKQIYIKWPNDLYLRERKLAGILVELTGSTTTSKAAQLVIGAGINLAMRRSSVQKKIINHGWINLQEALIEDINRNALTVRLIKKLRKSLVCLAQEGLSPFLSRWEQLDNFINRPVKLFIGDKVTYGISRGIDSHGALLLEQEDGIIKSWIGDEISLCGVE